MISLKDLYTGGVAPGISQGMQWAGQKQSIDNAKTRNQLAELALQNEPTRLSNQNRLAELTIQGRQQGIDQNRQNAGGTYLDYLRRALEGQGPISEIQDDETANQRYKVAQGMLRNAGIDLAGMPETVTAAELQAVGGINGTGKNNGVQTTFTTQDGKLGYVTRDGRTVVTDQNVQRSYQARDYGGMPYIFDNKSGALIPVGGGAEDDIREDIDKNRQEELTLEQQLEQARAYAKAEAEKQITQEGQMGTLNDALSVYNRLKSSDLGLIYGKGEKWVPEFMRSQRGIDLMADRDQLLGMLSLAGRGQLKGQGEITENEQKTLTEAQTVLGNPNISPEAAKRALHDAMNILRRMAGQPELERPPEEGGDSGASSGKSVKWGDL